MEIWPNINFSHLMVSSGRLLAKKVNVWSYSHGKKYICVTNDEVLPTMRKVSNTTMCEFSRLFVLVESHPFCTMLDLQLSFYRLLNNKSRAHCPLLQYLHTTSAILAGAQSYFVDHHLNVRERMVAMTQYPTPIISLMYSYQDSTCSCSEEVCVFYKFHLN